MSKPISTTFDVAASPAAVFDFLCNPRNLIEANHEGPVLASSDGPLQRGSWFVLALDQLRARVEYTEFEPDQRIAVSIEMSGRGSAGASSRHEFILVELAGGRGTRVEATADGQGGWLRWGPLVRAWQSASWQRFQKRLEAL